MIEMYSPRAISKLAPRNASTTEVPISYFLMRFLTRTVFSFGKSRRNRVGISEWKQRHRGVEMFEVLPCAISFLPSCLSVQQIQ